MQIRPAFFQLVLSSLYWALVALSTNNAVAQEQPEENPYGEDAHVAVILPLQSPSFGRHADSVRLGVLNAAGFAHWNAPRIRIYATNEDSRQIIDAYQRAVSEGARAVIGPLTRNGVTTLAYSGLISVPTLALNVPEGDTLLPRNLYAFGLQIETETRQVAQLAYRDGRRKVFLVAGESALGHRIVQAFAAEWTGLKAEIVGEFVYSTESAALAALREQLSKSGADSVFLSLDAPRARFIRAYLGSVLPVYATSQVFVSNSDTLANYDLEGVRFLDMPWLLQPDHPAVMTYQQQDSQSLTLDQERFRALGIDAYRIVMELLRPYQRMDSLDGVTGTISPTDGQSFTRALVPAHFSGGVARPLQPQPAQ
jgi:outer membrane PBP1 activator LpoA protein